MEVTPVAGSATGVTRKATGIATSFRKHFKRRLSANVNYKSTAQSTSVFHREFNYERSCVPVVNANSQNAL